MGEFSECPHCEYSGRNQQSLEDHINWAHPEVKGDGNTLEVNEREEESIDVDLTEPIPPVPRTPKRKFSPVRTPEEVITPEYFYVFHTYIHIQLMVILNFFLCLYAYLVERLRTWFVVMLLPAESFLLNHIARGLSP